MKTRPSMRRIAKGRLPHVFRRVLSLDAIESGPSSDQSGRIDEIPSGIDQRQKVLEVDLCRMTGDS